MDSESLSKAPREVTLGGKTYLVSKLVRGEWNAIQAWLRDHTTDPVVAVMAQIDKAKAKGINVDPEDRKELYESARREAKVWPPPVASEAWMELMMTEDASLKFLTVALRKHQPGISDQEIADAMEDATPDESRLLFYRAIGFNPDPKSEAPEPGAPTVQPAETTPGPESSPA